MLGLVYSVNALLTFMPAALQKAAGGDSGSAGFEKVTHYMNELSSYLIPVGGAFAVLGLIYGGCLLMAGAPHAGRTLVYVMVGVVVVMCSRGLAA